MIPQKYKDDLRRCEELGRHISSKIDDIFESRREAAERFSGLTGLKSGYSFITNYCGYCYPMELTSAPHHGTNYNPELHLKRLALLFTILNRPIA